MPPLPEGLLIELVTPLTSTGSLDQDSLKRLITLVGESAAAVVAGSPGVGEALELPNTVRLEAFLLLIESLPPDLPLFFGITAATPEETQDFAMQLEEEVKKRSVARPLYWLDLPLWWHSNRGLPQIYKNFSNSLSHPLIIMNHPHLIRGKSRPFKHINIRTAIFKKISVLPGVAAMIYRGEMRRFLHYYAAKASRPDFMLYEADERRFLSRPGARGLVSAGAQLFPVIWQAICQSCLFPEEIELSRKQLHEIWEWSNFLDQLSEIYQFYPAPLLKLGLHQWGVLNSPAIWPTTPSFPSHLGDQFLELLQSAKIGEAIR